MQEPLPDEQTDPKSDNTPENPFENLIIKGGSLYDCHKDIDMVAILSAN